MATARQVIAQSVVLNGIRYDVTLIDNPTIEDVLVTEARIQAAALASGVDVGDRKVSRDMKDFLIRLGVDL